MTDRHEHGRERLVTPLPTAPVLHWRIHYLDGSTIGSHETTWEAAKSSDIIAVVHALNDEPAQVEIGTPYYWHHGDWIARVWDPTLYLRQTGKVKFGRWASHALFQEAWKNALKTIGPNDHPDKFLTEQCLAEGSVMFTEPWQIGTATNQHWAVWYDDGTVWPSSACKWDALPTDGILAVAYHTVFSGVVLRIALRRYTFYYWKNGQLENTDDLAEVLNEFPQCKTGCPAFTGSSYRRQGLAIAAACADALTDVRARIARVKP